VEIERHRATVLDRTRRIFSAPAMEAISPEAMAIIPYLIIAVAPGIPVLRVTPVEEAIAEEVAAMEAAAAAINGASPLNGTSVLCRCYAGF
jgi:hypothetical protein